MNSTQRARKRERRAAARAAKQHDALAQCLDFERVFSFEALYAAELACRRGVMWKNSVIMFDKDRVANVRKLYDDLMSGAYEKGRPTRFTISERGKLRRISAVAFRDRVVQRALCDGSLVPVVAGSLVYDNAASLKGKGTSFARRRFVERLRKARRKWGSPWVAVADFSDYFGSIDSRRVFEMLRERYLGLASTDAERDGAERILAVLELFICEEEHLGLGNQTSQTAAIWYLNAIDHRAGAYGYYGRYMDDAYCICGSRERAEEFLEMLSRESARLGLSLNMKKTRVVDPSHGEVPFLKRMYSFSADGSLEARMAAKALRCTRRHLKGVRRLHGAQVLDDADLRAVENGVRAGCAGLTHARGLLRRKLHVSAAR